jgi:Zn-dependent protease
VRTIEESLGPPTRFDLNFRVGDIPVRVHPYFWLSTVLLGLPHRSEDVSQALMHLPIWVAVVFVSILVHELGHVLMGRVFGKRGHILFTGFCGLAIGVSDLPERWQRNLVSLAGPLAGFVFAGVITAACCVQYPAHTLFLLGSMFGISVPMDADTAAEVALALLVQHPHVWYTINILLWVNIFWGLVNLLPIWPLDGGQVSREICQHYRGREGVRLSVIISLATAAGLAVWALIELIHGAPLLPFPSFGVSLFPVIFFGLLAFQSGQLLRIINLTGGLDWEQEEEPRQPWERDPDWWKKGGE